MVLSTALALVGIYLFGIIYMLTRGSEITVTLGGSELVWEIVVATLITGILLALHEWIHGLTMRRFGGRPTYGGGVMYGIMPYFYCTAAGHKFTRSQFAIISIAPIVVISTLGAACITFLPYGGWLVVPLGVHLGGCIGDLWFLGVVFRQPQLTLFEDIKTGVRLHEPLIKTPC